MSTNTNEDNDGFTTHHNTRSQSRRNASLTSRQPTENHPPASTGPSATSSGTNNPFTDLSLDSDEEQLDFDGPNDNQQAVAHNTVQEIVVIPNDGTIPPDNPSPPDTSNPPTNDVTIPPDNSSPPNILTSEMFSPNMSTLEMFTIIMSKMATRDDLNKMVTRDDLTNLKNDINKTITDNITTEVKQQMVVLEDNINTQINARVIEATEPHLKTLTEKEKNIHNLRNTITDVKTKVESKLIDFQTSINTMTTNNTSVANNNNIKDIIKDALRNEGIINNANNNVDNNNTNSSNEGLLNNSNNNVDNNNTDSSNNNDTYTNTNNSTTDLDKQLEQQSVLANTIRSWNNAPRATTPYQSAQTSSAPTSVNPSPMAHTNQQQLGIKEYQGDGTTTLNENYLSKCGFGKAATDTEDLGTIYSDIMTIYDHVMSIWTNDRDGNGPQVHKIVNKFLTSFPKLLSTDMAAVVDFYDKLQRVSHKYCMPLTPFDYILLQYKHYGLCIPNMGRKYRESAMGLLEILPYLIPHTLSSNYTAIIASVQSTSKDQQRSAQRVSINHISKTTPRLAIGIHQCTPPPPVASQQRYFSKQLVSTVPCKPISP